MEVKEKMRIKQKLLSVLNDLEQKYIEEKSRFAKLENVLQKEGKDVKKLEGLSLTGLFFTILGSKEQQLEKERQEYLAVKLKYDECNNSISAIKDQLKDTKQKMNQLKDIELQHKYILKEKENFILNNNSAVAREVIQISEEITGIQSNIRELKEAIAAGNAVLEEVNHVIDSLKSAQGWGTWDLLGGGLISTAIKHSRINDARDSVHQVQQKLLIFQRDLKDLDLCLKPGISIDIGKFTAFADYFFGGLIIDWIVQSGINNSLTGAVSLKNKMIENVRYLQEALENNQIQLSRVKQEKETLILNM
jgi:prefoldin subunit 5